ncbi:MULTISPECIES: DUF4397 domain-containing protein [Gammaproteobacteria]|uniref:DUF4397 domain-containing protein n=1 Tax=Gammaproteobacteria TaxID=1236 RepID=UPI000DD09382|nr:MULTISPECIES: DUF4397 domain-containing protein [Gammaproteobacteria]RTE86487.1 DUF4397 domain-containing protein [Aliidiomarina sp. B3213]TCZ90958.1 DUF4397 domain-containing protein [Lysobacter sp. N42]
MNKITTVLSVSALALALSACDDSDGPTILEPNPPEPGDSYVRVHHAAADAPRVNVAVDGEIFLEDVDYQVSSGVTMVTEGTYSVGVDAILPDQTTPTVIGPVDLDLAADMRYEVVALGSVADETLEPLVIANEVSDVASGEARIQVLHGLEGGPTVDVFLTEVDADLSMAQPAATLAYQDYTPQVDVTAGEYQIRVTVSGDTDTVVFDSGAVMLEDGADLFLTATANVAANTTDRPLALLVADGAESSVLYSQDTGADVRVVHAVSDAPNVDVLVDGAVAISDLAFPDYAGYVNLAANTYDIAVTPTGQNGTVVIDAADTALANAQAYSVFAVGLLGDSTITAAILADSNRRVATEAIVRIVHASPAAGEVDIYVTATDDISEADPAFTAVDFDAAALQSTGNVALTPGEYYVTVTPTGSKTAAIGPIMLDLQGGGLYTAVAVDPSAGGTLPQLILMDDLDQ